ncbi:MAG: transcriptional repressor [Spirochaetota bacterium]|nr:transcriptional repressor [Spirochaetota bacterium]
MHKTSRQRDGITFLLSKKNYHPTVDEIYDLMRKDFSKISLATVYRNLDTLQRMGKINKIDIPDQPARYDGNTNEHFHIRCTACGYIEDVCIDFNIKDYVDVNAAMPNFELTECFISFAGFCKKCKRKQSKK